MLSNAPAFHDFVAEHLGHRRWYVAARRRPALEARRGLVRLAPAAYDDLARLYQHTFGAHPAGRDH